MWKVGWAVLGAALFLGGCDNEDVGRYTMTRKSDTQVWVLDTKTGEITLCWEAPLGASCQYATNFPRMSNNSN